MDYEIKRMDDGQQVMMEICDEFVKDMKKEEQLNHYKDDIIKHQADEIVLLNEENEYLLRQNKNVVKEHLSMIPMVLSHLYKDDKRFDSTTYNQALDDAKNAIKKWLE